MATKSPGSWALGVGPAGWPQYGVGNLLPFSGNYYFVDPVNGNDGATGGPSDPLRTLSQALTVCTAGQNDCVFLLDTASQLGLTSTLTWSKSQTHLIGVGSNGIRPGPQISSTGSTVFTPLVSVTGTGCIFQNIAAFHGFGSTTAQTCWAESGGQNYYNRVRLSGMADSGGIAGAQAGSRTINVGGAGRNTFEDCLFGGTVIRGAANSTMEFSNTTRDNVIRRCTFEAVATTGSAVHFSANSSGAVLGWQLFDQCNFINNTKMSTPNVGSTLSGVAIMSATVGGVFLLNQCASVGATKWEGTASNFLFLSGATPTGTAGITVNNI